MDMGKKHRRIITIYIEQSRTRINDQQCLDVLDSISPLWTESVYDNLMRSLRSYEP